jgi:hypothetical protein
MHPRTPSVAAAAAAALAITALAGCGGSTTPADFTLMQSPPRILARDQGTAGVSTADTMVFRGKLAKDGAAFGTVYGEQTVHAGLQEGTGRAIVDIRMADLIFDLPDGQIVAHGVGTFPRGDWRLRSASPVVRAIVGGTKAYIGARGELTTTRNANGTYTQAFHFSE